MRSNGTPWIVPIISLQADIQIEKLMVVGQLLQLVCILIMLPCDNQPDLTKTDCRTQFFFNGCDRPFRIVLYMWFNHRYFFGGHKIADMDVTISNIMSQVIFDS